MGRMIGLRHRVKQTAEGEARPTQLFIQNGAGSTVLELGSEDEELAFAQGYEKNGVVYGLEPGDTVLTILGGSGGFFTYALSRKAEEVGASVMQTPPYRLKEAREQRGQDKEADAALLVEMYQTHPDHYYPTKLRDRQLLLVRELTRTLEEAIKHRIACDNTLRQLFIGRVFTSSDGLYPEGSIEQSFDAHRASHKASKALAAVERECERELVKTLKDLDVYTNILEPLEGCGPRIAGRLLSAIGDIRRFETPSKLKAFCGAHVLADGRFPRRRRGQISNWHPMARQALYLFSDQWNRRPGSLWGQKLIENKVMYRNLHPDVVVEGGKKRYTDGHIAKMAKWRTITQFVEWFFEAWQALEKTS